MLALTPDFLEVCKDGVVLAYSRGKQPQRCRRTCPHVNPPLTFPSACIRLCAGRRQADPRLVAVYADGCRTNVAPRGDADTECDCPCRSALQGLLAA